MTVRPRQRIRLGHAGGSSFVLAAAAALAVTGFAGACSLSSDDTAPAVVEASTPTEDPVDTPTPADDPTQAPPAWSPVHERGSQTVVRRAGQWRDPPDARARYVDVRRVQFSYDPDLPNWWIDLAAKPPRARGLVPGRLIAYGLVLDTDGDNDADYVVGIDNAAPKRGDFHVWLTDLATGETTEQVGPPYGHPVEFAHPDERDGLRSVNFSFLGTWALEDFPAAVRFYAWAAESRNGEIVASDYAPDEGWIARR